jgi:hypothetical protein
MRHLQFIAFALIAICFVFTGSRAQDTDTPILTIEGAIASNDPVDMTMKEIEEIGFAKVTTTTPWHDGTVTFSGVPMTDLLKKVGATGSKISVIALNNYHTEIPVSDFEKYEVILATKKDGEYMPISDKGPLFIVYPFDSDKELKSEVFYSRAAWQVRTITVE